MNSDTVKPIPASAPTPRCGATPAPSGSCPSPSRTAQPAEAGDADELADHEPDGDADEHDGRVGEARRRRVTMPALASAKIGTMT